MMTTWTDKNETSYSFEHVLKIWRYVESKNEKNHLQDGAQWCECSFINPMNASSLCDVNVGL